LFAPLQLRDCFLYLLPGILLAIGAGLISPYMTVLLAQTFNALSAFVTVTQGNPSPAALDQAKHDLLSTILRISAILIGLCFVKLALNASAGSFFAVSGETTVRRLRREVYDGVSSKPLAWFDLGMGMKQDGPDGDAEASTQGSAGLMSRFIR
jgi:ATP-binding cassette subfamily B (MDR/TAP) protein 1